jgi:transcriptional regulator with XRE-family HTH domain
MFRKLAGWTQEELAERVGVSRYTIINLENGYTKMTMLHYCALRFVFDSIVRKEIAKYILIGDGVYTIRKEKVNECCISSKECRKTGSEDLEQA